MTERRFEFLVASEQAGMRLDQFLATRELPFSRSQIKRRIDEGEVLVNTRSAKASMKVRAGDVILFAPPPPEPSELEPEALPLAVLYEDEHLIVIDKPPGMVVHPSAGHARGTLVHALLHHCKDLRGVGGELRPGIVHRIDKDTSGVLIVAKDERTLAGLQTLFKTHDLERKYWALVAPAPKSAAGELRTRFGRHPRDRKKFSSKVATGKEAITRYQTLERFSEGGAALVEATLLTGRTHQIRVHFRDHGFPVLGDAVYGRAPANPLARECARELGRQALHARLLRIRHPILDRELTFTSEPPADFMHVLARLRAGE